MTDKAICRNDGRCEYAAQIGAEGEGHCPAGKCAMPCDNSAAHLTIPGALEWDGDNGTHSADGESRAHGESDAAIATLKSLGYTHNDGTYWKPPVGQKPDFDLIDQLRADLALERHTSKFWMDAHGEDLTKFGGQIHDLRTQLANTEQSRRSFFDLSQDLEKKLAEHKALLLECQPALEKAGYSTWQIDELLSASAKPASPAEIDPFAATEAPYVPLSAAEVEAFMSMGDSNKAKPKTCIECDQPYCRGVCVERGDQDYDRDQAAKGGDDE